MRARGVAAAGLVAAVAVGVASFLLPPSVAVAALRPIGVFLFSAAVLLYWPMLRALFSRETIYGSHLLGASVVLLSAGLALPTIQQLLRSVCVAGTSCWFAVTSARVSVLVFAMILLVAAPLVSQRSGRPVSRWSTYWTLGVSLALAAATLALY